MWRSMANRVLDMICPGGSFSVPWELWDKSRRPRLPVERGADEYELLFGYRTPPLWSNWTYRQRLEMRRHGRINPTDAGSH